MPISKTDIALLLFGITACVYVFYKGGNLTIPLLVTCFYFLRIAYKGSVYKEWIYIISFAVLGFCSLNIGIIAESKENLIINVILGLFLLCISFFLWRTKQRIKQFTPPQEKEPTRYQKAASHLGKFPYINNIHTAHLKLIGHISGVEREGLEWIGIIKGINGPIPFHLADPFYITELNDIPVISIFISHIGDDLLKLPRHRDYLPFYDRSVFASPDFHGYVFSSEEEKLQTIQTIKHEVKDLFITDSGQPLAYCVEVVYWDEIQTATHSYYAACMLADMIKEVRTNPPVMFREPSKANTSFTAFHENWESPLTHYNNTFKRDKNEAATEIAKEIGKGLSPKMLLNLYLSRRRRILSHMLKQLLDTNHPVIHACEVYYARAIQEAQEKAMRPFAS